MSKKSKHKPKEENKEQNQNKWREFAKEQDPEDTEEPSESEFSVREEIDFPGRDKLEDQLTAMEKKVDEYKDKAARYGADMENFRRRAERDIANAHKFGAEKLLMDLLPVVDSMVRGLESPESHDPHAKSMREGISLTLDLLHKTLLKHGIKIIDPYPGEAFNPELHEAMSAVKDPNAKPNTIVQVIQKGYELNGRVLRAAMVIVAQ